MTDVQHQTICMNPESTSKVNESNHTNSQQQPSMAEIKNDIQHIQQDGGIEGFTYITEDYKYLSQNTDINQWYYDEFSGIYRQNEYGGDSHHQQQLDKSNITATAVFHSLPIAASHSDLSLSTDSNKDSVTTSSQTSSIHRVDSHKDVVSDYPSSTSSSSSSSLSYLNYTSKFSSSSISFLQSNPKSNTIIHPFPWPESVDRIYEWCELAKTSKDPNAKLKLCQRLLLTLSIDDSDRIQEKTKNKLLYQQNKNKATNITTTTKPTAAAAIKQQESLVPSPERNKIRKTMMLECLRLLKKLSGGQSLGKGGDSEAQYILANCYGMGLLGLTEDHSKAFQWYVQASKQSHPEATYRTAVCHELGIGTRQDGQRALVFYRKAAHLAHVGSMYKLGIILLRGYYQTTPMPREAISWLQRAASHHQIESSLPSSIKTNNNASRPLSMLTDLTNTSSSSSTNHHSNSNHKNITLSSSASATSSSSSTNTSIQQDILHDYTSSSILDHLSSSSSITLNSSYQSSHALHALAMIQLTGEVGDATSLIADPVYALELLQQAAQSGYIPSQVQLGHCYEHGQWVAMDDALSIYWYARAAEQGNPEGCLALSGWYLTGSTTKGVLIASDKEAYLWARRAAITMVQATEQWTVAKAHYAVAIFLERGIGVKQDVEKAKKWLLRAAVLGHAGAKHSLLSKEEQQEWLLQQQKISNRINKSRKQYEQQQQEQNKDGQKIKHSKEEEEKIKIEKKNQENKNKASNAADSTCTVM